MTGLLLCWYLQTRRSAVPVPDSQTTLDLLIREAAAEVEAVEMKAVDDLTIFPLEANAEILHNSSVWSCKQASPYHINVSYRRRRGC